MEYKKLIESIVSGGYPDDGSTGPASDDDLPTGTTVFGDKMVPVKVDNRLTGSYIKHVPADELGQKWNYDEFEYSQPMGSRESYSDTLNSLNKLLGDRLWKHTTRRKQHFQSDKEDARSSNDIDQDSKLSDDEEESMEITEKINKYLGQEEINEAVISISDRKSLSKVLLSGKNAKINIKSLDTNASIINNENNVVISYKESEDFTLSLVDIADSLGMDFKVRKAGGKQIFVMTK